MKPDQNDRYFGHNIFKCIFFDQICHNLIKISINFVYKGQINFMSVLVTAWQLFGTKRYYLKKSVLSVGPLGINLLECESAYRLFISKKYISKWCLQNIGHLIQASMCYET